MWLNMLAGFRKLALDSLQHESIPTSIHSPKMCSKAGGCSAGGHV